MIVGATSLAQANSMSQMLGYGPNSFTVALSPTGSSPATHYGNHAWVDQQFVDTLTSASQGTLVFPGVDSAALQSLISSMVISKKDISYSARQHFNEVLTANNLVEEIIMAHP